MPAIDVTRVDIGDPAPLEEEAKTKVVVNLEGGFFRTFVMQGGTASGKSVVIFALDNETHDVLYLFQTTVTALEMAWAAIKAMRDEQEGK